MRRAARRLRPVLRYSRLELFNARRWDRKKFFWGEKGALAGRLQREVRDSFDSEISGPRLCSEYLQGAASQRGVLGDGGVWAWQGRLGSGVGSGDEDSGGSLSPATGHRILASILADLSLKDRLSDAD